MSYLVQNLEFEKFNENNYKHREMLRGKWKLKMKMNEIIIMRKGFALENIDVITDFGIFTEYCDNTIIEVNLDKIEDAKSFFKRYIVEIKYEEFESEIETREITLRNMKKALQVFKD